VDFIVKLPLAKEFDSILVVCDRLTKMAHFILMAEKTLVKKLVVLFKNNV